MKLIDIIKSANSNLLRNKGRTFLTILAIFIGSFTIIATSGIRTGVNNYIDTQMESAGGEGYIEIMPKALQEIMQSMMSFGSSAPTEYNPETNSTEMTVISEEDLEKIRQIPGIQSVKGARNIEAEYITSAKTDKKYLISPQALPSDRITIDIAEGRMIDIGGSAPEIILQPGYAEVLGYQSDADIVGETIELAVTEQATMQVQLVEVKVVGVLNKSIINMGRSWVNVAAETEILDVLYAHMPESYRNMVMFATAEWDSSLGDEGLEKIKDDLDALGFTGMTFEDQVGMIKSFFDAIILVFTIFGGIALLAASIGIINTLFMAVQERTREIGLMKAMGLGRGKIFLMFSVEAVALGFWGSAIGVGVAYLAKLIINPVAADTFLKDLPGFNLMEFDISMILILVAVVMAIAFLAGTLPARRAAKKDPIEALRYE
ncbi:MAG: FtsX-like permease family protein [Candidatus Nomurabacteria bacterium]|jgi:putative ABC transport system permease protein|nr:FtsX-like permease family protein [Candidatus Nomurabacteria bacterium]